MSISRYRAFFELVCYSSNSEKSVVIDVIVDYSLTLLSNASCTSSWCYNLKQILAIQVLKWMTENVNNDVLTLGW